MEEKHYYHICTRGVPGNIIFKDKEDFRVAVNKIALCFCIREDLLDVVSLVVMSNHLHIIVCGNEESARKAILSFKNSYSIYYSAKYGIARIFSHVPVSVKDCSDIDYLKTAIGYVYRNPLKHGVTRNPFSYQWSSINIHFTAEDTSTALPMGSGGLNNRELDHIKADSRMFGFRYRVPDSWEMTADGMLSFASFIKTSYVENIFRTMKALSFFIIGNKDSTDDNELEINSESNGYQYARDKAIDIAGKLFKNKLDGHHVSSRDESDYSGEEQRKIHRKILRDSSELLIQSLDTGERAMLANELHWRFGIPMSVIKRILNAGSPGR